MRLLDELGFERSGISFVFQLYLGFVDSINILLMYLLLRGLKIRGAAWATLLFAVLPSTRVGGNLWGQIDGVSQCFLSLGLLCGLRSLAAEEQARDRRALRYFAGLNVSLGAAILTKQLVAFSLPGLALLWVAVAWKLIKRGRALQSAAVVAMSTMLTLLVDQLFPTPPGYYGSGVLYVLATGSDHAKRILHHGVSIFASLPLKDSDPSKSTYPLFSILNLQVSIIPFYFGLALFSCSSFALLWRCLRGARRGGDSTSIEVVALSLVIGAACNLFMNTAMTGTHERYLYHYGFFVFPFILLVAQSGRFPRALIALTVLHLSLYGAFVYHILMGYYDVPSTAYLQHATVLGNVVFSIFLIYAAAFWSRVDSPRR